MFRPVQNPDDEEAEGRVRTRTRTKELVITLTCQFLTACVVSSCFPRLCQCVHPLVPYACLELKHHTLRKAFIILSLDQPTDLNATFFNIIFFVSFIFTTPPPFFFLFFILSRFPILLSYSLNCAITIGVQNARNRPKQDSGNNSPEPEGNERRSHRKSPSSASNCSSSSSSVVHEKVSRPIIHASPSLLRFANRMNSQRLTNCLTLHYQFLPYPFFVLFLCVVVTNSLHNSFTVPCPRRVVLRNFTKCIFLNPIIY